MKALCLLGSPRSNGNSATLARGVGDVLKAKGVDISYVRLNELRLRGCQACTACKRLAQRCVAEDDLNHVMKQVPASHIVILAGPIYFGDVSAQLKMFIDRCYEFLTPDFQVSERKTRLPPGKKLVMILTQGHPDTRAFEEVFGRYEYYFGWLGFRERYLIRGVGLQEESDVLRNKELLSECRRLALQLTSLSG